MSVSGFEGVAAENLIRRHGVYYLNAKVGGRKIRRSLRTDSLKIAKIRRDEALAAERARVVGCEGAKSYASLGDVFEEVLAARMGKPKLRPNTRKYYHFVGLLLRKTLPLKAKPARFRASEAATWWSNFAAKYSASESNAALSIVKDLAKVLQKEGFASEDVTTGLARVTPPRSAVELLPSVAEFERVVDSIRRQGQRRSEEAACLIEFLAASGLRKGEAQRLTWEDVSAEWLTVREGKGANSFRRVPVIPACEEVLNRIRQRTGSRLSGPLFYLREPRASLTAACKRERVGHLRVHDLRHLFATRCIESGVPVPTVAKWLGHKDGGVLAMRTYGHVRDDHSLREAQRVK